MRLTTIGSLTLLSLPLALAAPSHHGNAGRLGSHYGRVGKCTEFGADCAVDKNEFCDAKTGKISICRHSPWGKGCLIDYTDKKCEGKRNLLDIDGPRRQEDQEGKTTYNIPSMHDDEDKERGEDINDNDEEEEPVPEEIDEHGNFISHDFEKHDDEKHGDEKHGGEKHGGEKHDGEKHDDKKHDDQKGKDDKQKDVDNTQKEREKAEEDKKHDGEEKKNDQTEKQRHGFDYCTAFGDKCKSDGNEFCDNGKIAVCHFIPWGSRCAIDFTARPCA